MLAKKNKIETHFFSSLEKKKKKVVHTPYFTATQYEQGEACKIACIISKKVFKKAHQRNKVRRTFYRACKKELERQVVEKKPPTGLFFCVAKKGILETVSEDELLFDIKKILFL